MELLNTLIDNFTRAKADYDARIKANPRTLPMPDFALEQSALGLAAYIVAIREHIKLELPEGVIDGRLETDRMIAQTGTYFGQPIVLACDANCAKAWGRNSRPRVYRTVSGEYAEVTSDADMIDEDDYAYLADPELGTAPTDSPFTESDEHKPEVPAQRLNKWCARECERSVIVDVDQIVELPDFSQRRYNIAPHMRSAQSADDE